MKPEWVVFVVANVITIMLLWRGVTKWRNRSGANRKEEQTRNRA